MAFGFPYPLAPNVVPAQCTIITARSSMRILSQGLHIP